MLTNNVPMGWGIFSVLTPVNANQFPHMSLGRDGGPEAPLTYFNDGGGGPSNFFGSEILAQSDFLGSMKRHRNVFGSQKNRGIFWGCEKRTKGFFWVCK